MNTLRVLLVEDDAPSRDLAQTRLSLLGYQVTPCANGKEALAMCAAQDKPFDLALVDLHMPVMNGQDLIAKLRDDPCTASLPILVVSADPDAAKDTAADHVIGKPYHLHQLVMAIAVTMERREAVSEVKQT
jgi:CheY-like chemotaxis protein